jgi:hypothetical protein
MLPSTLEWHLALALAGLAAFFWPLAGAGAAAMLALSLMVAALRAAQARLAPAHDGLLSRLLIMGLCYAQPLVRSWRRYRTRLFAYRPPRVDPALAAAHGAALSPGGTRTAAYWSEEGRQRTELLARVVAYLNERAWGRTIDSGWADWDLEVYCDPWTVVQVCTTQEDHGGRRHLLRVRYRLRPSGYTKALGAAALLAGLLAAAFWAWPPAAGAGVLLGAGLALWWRGTRRAAHAVAVFDALACDLGLIPCAGSDGGLIRGGASR